MFWFSFSRRNFITNDSKKTSTCWIQYIQISPSHTTSFIITFMLCKTKFHLYSKHSIVFLLKTFQAFAQRINYTFMRNIYIRIHKISHNRLIFPNIWIFGKPIYHIESVNLTFVRIERRRNKALRNFFFGFLGNL